MRASPNERRAGDLADSWPLIAGGFVISFVMVGGGIDTVGVFLNALSVAMGWSRSSLSLGVSLGAASAALSTPFVGMLIDRFGVRVPVAIGTALLGVGFSVLMVMEAPWHFIAANLILGPGFAACALLPITIAVTIRVPHRTTLALGIVAAGASAGALVLAPGMQAVVEAFGWRTAYVAMGIAMIATPLPILLFVLPAGRLREVTPQKGGLAEERPLLRELGQRPGVVALTAVMVLPALTSFSISVHLVPYLTGLGHAGTTAASALGAAIGVSAIGKIAGGWMGDRLGALATLRLALGVGAAGLAVLTYATSSAALAFFVVCHGISLGTYVALMPAIAIRVLGSERFGTIFGLLQLAAMLASAVGPVASGVIFDETGSYAGAIVLWFSAVLAAGALAFWIPSGSPPLIAPEETALA